jgi:hypothetical protein
LAKGIRRIKNGWGDQDNVLVKYPDGAEMEIPASQYVAQGHHPPIDALPVRSLSLRLRLAKRAIPMLRGPEGEKRPTDVNGCAVMIARNATGEIEDLLSDNRPRWT